ncbi:MAG: 7TM diverse intracellular signaling domain-containing protein [Bacteroidota bacterium]
MDADGNFIPEHLKVSDTISLLRMISTEIHENPRGYGTYRFFINQKDLQENLVINIQRVLGASEVWINGQKIASHGKISQNGEGEKIDGRPFIVELPNETSLDVMLVFSNHKHRLGGGYSLRNSIQTKASYTQKNKSAFLIEGMITFLIIIFGLYQILYFSIYRKYQTYLFLGLFCLFGGVRQLFVGEALIYSFFPEISFDIVQKIRYIGYYGGLGSAFLYHDKLFPGYFTSIVKKIGGITPFLGCIFVLVTPTYYGTFSAPIFQVCGLFIIIVGFHQTLSAARDNKPFARGILISTSITLLFFANDLLNAMLIIQTVYIVNYGLLLYVISQVILNSKIQKKTEKELLQLASDISTMAMRIQRKEQEITALRSETFQQLKSKEKLVENLKKVASNDDSVSIQNMIASLKSELLEDSQLNRIKNDIETLNQEFAQRIKELHPSLTPTDIEICSYLRLSLGRKEIAKLRFTSVDAVKKSRNRIRKKMNLAPEEDLDTYIKSI